MKIALVADTHFGVRGDSLVFLEHYSRFFSQQFFPFLRKHGIKTVIHLGDLVDNRKRINFRTLEVMKKFFLEPIRKDGLEFHVIVGNHDTFLKNTNRINAPMQLFSRELQVHQEICDVTIGGSKMTFIPWICPENKEKTVEHLKKTDARFAFGHLELNGFQVQHGVVHEHGEFSGQDFSKFEKVFSGHFHHKQSNGHVFYLGTPYEMTFADLDDPKGFYTFDTETGVLEFIRNPDNIFTRVVYDDSNPVEYTESMFKGKFVRLIVRRKDDVVAFEQFLEQVHECSPAKLSIIEENEILEEKTEDGVLVSEDTISIVNRYVDGINMNDEMKAPLKELMRNLYMEALTREEA